MAFGRKWKEPLENPGVTPIWVAGTEITDEKEVQYGISTL